MLKKCMCLILSAVLTMTLVVQVWADEEVKVTSGQHENRESISTDKDKGADVDADRGDSSLDVKGDVEVHSSGDYSTPVTGIEVSAENGGSTVVTVGGDVEVVSDKSDKVTGVDVNINSAGSAVTVDVKGGISAAGTNGVSEVTGIKAAVVDGGSLNAAIGGDISSTGKDATGIDVKASGQSSVNVNVSGGINTEKKDSTDSTKGPRGLQLEASGDGTKVSARVAGDVKGSGMDSSVEIKTENGTKVDVVAEGTLSAGKEAAVAFAGSPDNVSLIIWKAEAGTDGSIVKEVIDNNGNETLEKTEAAETLESSIHYIIRVDTSQSIDLGNTKEMSYTAPDGSVINYNTAKEGEKVAVKLNVPSGYVLKGVFSDEARQCSLQKEGGEYYLIVPKGGGVFVNMWLEASAKEPAGKKSGGENKDKDHETTYEGSEGNPVTALNEAGAYTMGITEEKLEMSMTGSNRLNISFPAGTDRFTLNLADIQQYIEAGISQFVINTPYGALEIPVNNLLPYLQAGIPVTFTLNNGLIEVLVNGSVIRLSAQQAAEQPQAQQGVAGALQQAAEVLQKAAEQQQTQQAVAEARALQQKAEQQYYPYYDVHEERYRNATAKAGPADRGRELRQEAEQRHQQAIEQRHQQPKEKGISR